MDQIFVGVDVSKERLDVHVLPAGETFSVERTGAGIEALVLRLKPLQPTRIAIEATGGFETIVAAGLAGAGLAVVVVNPGQVRSFARALGQRAKTDPIDAKVIARFVMATLPELRVLADEETEFLAGLVARRRQIVEMIAAESQRGRRVADKRASGKRLAKSIARVKKALETELAELDAMIDEAVRGSPLWHAKENLLASVPGVGPVVARTLIADMPELGRLNRKQIAALAGLAPFTRQSGQWKGKSFIAGGRASVRTVLFLAAQSAKRHNPQLRAFYQRLVAAGRPKMVATIAVARKLLTILNAIIKQQTPWQQQNA